MPSGVEKHLEASARIIKLALAFYRKQQVQLPDAEHAESMLTLLRLANGEAELMAWATRLTGAAEGELHLACIAFIEHAFFTVATDHFGVLGLNPWANAADVKEHYRLLMRLFHPDRGLVNSASADRYAAMINQAYATLKQELPVAAETNHQKSSVLLKHESQSASMRSRMIRAALAQRVDAGLLTWLTPAKLLLVFALLATLIVWVFFEPFRNPKIEIIDVVDVVNANPATTAVATTLPNSLAERESKPVTTTDSDSVEHHLQDISTEKLDSANALAIAQLAKIEQDLKSGIDEAKQVAPAAMPLGQAPTKIPATVTLQSSVTPQNKVTPQNNLLIQPKASAQTKSSAGNAVVPALKPLKKDAVAGADNFAVKPSNGASDITNQPISAPQPMAEVPVNPGVITSPANVNTATIVRADNLTDATPTTRELRELMIQFTDGYERGDIEAFMQVFTDDLASDEPGGKSGFKQAYSILFDTTISRVMMIQNLHWSKKAKMIIGEAEYRIKTKESNKSDVYDSHGTFRFEVVKSNNKAKIAGFYYVVAND
jgi:hypothetical protein